MSRSLITLRQAAYHARMMEVACKRCSRRGSLSLRRLIAEHGPDYPCNTVMKALAQDCPQQQAHAPWDRCFVYCTNPCGL